MLKLLIPKNFNASISLCLDSTISHIDDVKLKRQIAINIYMTMEIDLKISNKVSKKVL
tara:strand:- start:138 stop:311 length:174 start_codon:yes stop_codon:yes gene_type:complete